MCNNQSFKSTKIEPKLPVQKVYEERFCPVQKISTWFSKTRKVLFLFSVSRRTCAKQKRNFSRRIVWLVVLVPRYRMVRFWSHLTQSERLGVDKLLPDNRRVYIGKSEYFRTTLSLTKGGESEIFPIKYDETLLEYQKSLDIKIRVVGTATRSWPVLYSTFQSCTKVRGSMMSP